MLTVGVIAGEASGSALGAGLIEALQQRHGDVRIVGVGGDDMAKLGAELWFNARELSVMGLAEVLRHLPRLLRLRRQLRKQFLAANLDVFIGIDLPDFNLSVARWLRKRGVPTLQYVSPSVWAWREKRVRGIAKAVDEVLCLLPFEPEFYAKYDTRARFVGHPLADDIDQARPQGPARQALGLPHDSQVVALMPGSRRSEIQATGPIFAQAVARLAIDNPALQVLVPVADPSLRSLLNEVFAEHASGLSVRWLDRDARTAMAASDVVLLASGTATLEAMLIGRPMVVGYRLAATTSWLLRRLSMIRITHFSLPNLLADAPLVPELMQENLTVDAVAQQVQLLLNEPTGNAALLARFDELRGVLANNASAHAADAVLEHARAVT